MPLRARGSAFLCDPTLFIKPLLESLETLAEYVHVIEERLGEGKRVFGVVTGDRLSGVMRTLIPSDPECSGPFGKGAVDESHVLQLFKLMASVFFFTPSSMQAPSTVLRTITVQAEYALASKQDFASSHSRRNGAGI